MRTKKAQHAHNVKRKKYGQTIQQSHRSPAPDPLSQAKENRGQGKENLYRPRGGGNGLKDSEEFISRSRGRLFDW
jgi:hypothetical protein